MIDVSQWQGVIDWKQVADHGVQRAFVKLGQFYSRSGYDHDPYALENLAGARAHGIATGVYWFASPANAPHREAAAFLRLYEPHLRSSDILPALDLETTGGHDWGYLNDWKAQWFAVVDSHIGKRCFFYSYWYFWKQMRLYADRPVWGAATGAGFRPPASWTLWQRSFTGTVPGIVGHVDMSTPLRPVPTIGGGHA